MYRQEHAYRDTSERLTRQQSSALEVGATIAVMSIYNEPPRLARLRTEGNMIPLLCALAALCRTAQAAQIVDALPVDASADYVIVGGGLAGELQQMTRRTCN
jgi:hypothetical protein